MQLSVPVIYLYTEPAAFLLVGWLIITLLKFRRYIQYQCFEISYKAVTMYFTVLCKLPLDLI